MPKMLLWDLSQRKYVPYTPPKDAPYEFSTVSHDDRFISCAGCGRPLITQTAYTSALIQDESGFGYCLCVDCMTKEIQRRRYGDTGKG